MSRINSVSDVYNSSDKQILFCRRYIALYNYKPHKKDEIELVKGRYYTVAEKCQDGWFQGACLSSGRAGVFPGNYVQMVRLSAAKKSSMATALLASRTTGAPVLVTPAHAAVNRTHSFPKTSPHHRKPSRKCVESAALAGVNPVHVTQPIIVTSLNQAALRSNIPFTNCTAAAARVSSTSTSSSASPTSPVVSDVMITSSTQSPKVKRKSSRMRNRTPADTTNGVCVEDQPTAQPQKPKVHF